jgi:hypothetical protein
LGKPFRIISFEGPFKGSAADVSILRDTILSQLQDNEKLIADKGYLNEKKCITPPKGRMNQLTVEEKLERRKVTHIRQVNERVIGRLKMWGCFNKRWQSNWKMNKLCCHVAAKLTQLELYVYPLT